MPVPRNGPIVIAPSPTPFGQDDAVDFGAIERNVERWAATPLSGFVLNSENGEEAFLSEEERLEIVRTVHGVNQGRMLIVGGIDSPSVRETLRIAEALATAGAEMVRIRIPRLTSDIRGYFEQVLAQVPLPVLIIHQMAPGTFLSVAAAPGAPVELIGELLTHERVLGYIASADLRFEGRVRQQMPPGKHFWAGNASLLLPSVVLGADGACMMLANVAPEQCHQILRLAADGDWTAARREQQKILELDWQILSLKAAGLKAALRELGFDAGLPRAPSPACSPEHVQRLRNALQTAGLLGAS